MEYTARRPTIGVPTAETWPMHTRLPRDYLSVAQYHAGRCCRRTRKPQPQPPVIAPRGGCPLKVFKFLDGRAAIKRGKLNGKRVDDWYFDWCCARCGTSRTPERRNGPQGPKTLCNRCGLAHERMRRRRLEEKRRARPSPEEEARRVKERMAIDVILCS